MNKRVVAMMPVFLILGGSLFAAPAQFTGTATDDMRARKHTMMQGKPDSECVRACVKAGRQYALLVGDEIYKLQGHSAELDGLSAKKVRVTGDLAGDVIHVSSVEAAK